MATPQFWPLPLTLIFGLTAFHYSGARLGSRFFLIIFAQPGSLVNRPLQPHSPRDPLSPTSSHPAPPEATWFPPTANHTPGGPYKCKFLQIHIHVQDADSLEMLPGFSKTQGWPPSPVHKWTDSKPCPCLVHSPAACLDAHVRTCKQLQTFCQAEKRARGGRQSSRATILMNPAGRAPPEKAVLQGLIQSASSPDLPAQPWARSLPQEREGRGRENTCLRPNQGWGSTGVLQGL